MGKTKQLIQKDESVIQKRHDSVIAKWIRKELDRSLDKGEPTIGLDSILLQYKNIILHSTDFDLHVYLLDYLYFFLDEIGQKIVEDFSVPFLDSDSSLLRLSSGMNLILTNKTYNDKVNSKLSVIHINKKEIEINENFIFNQIDSVRNWEHFCNALKFHPNLIQCFKNIPFTKYKDKAEEICYGNETRYQSIMKNLPDELKEQSV